MSVRIYQREKIGFLAYSRVQGRFDTSVRTVLAGIIPE
jgi:hypothetical protein